MRLARLHPGGAAEGQALRTARAALAARAVRKAGASGIYVLQLA